MFIPNEKYGFAAVVRGRAMSFAPFESPLTAEAVRSQLVALGVDVGEVVPVHTVGTARGMVWALRSGHRLWWEGMVESPPPPPARQIASGAAERPAGRWSRWIANR
jgi:hypothetical protein